MLIGELGEAVGLPSQTIRFYERTGLLPAPPRAANGYRSYDESTITRVTFIRAAQSAGLTLVEIRGRRGVVAALRRTARADPNARARAGAKGRRSARSARDAVGPLAAGAPSDAASR